MRGNKFLFLILCLGIMLLASCGGGGTTVSPDPGNNNPPAGSEEPQSFEQWSADTELEGNTRTVRGIPPIPVDTGRDTSDADDNRTVLGKDAIDYSQCAIDGDAMLINEGAIADTNPGGEPAWAMYKISGLNDFNPLSLNVECRPGHGKEYSVAVADYTVLDWKWYGPTGLPELQAELDDDHSYITNIGNLYFLVVCYGDNTATHLQSTLVADMNPEPVLPGAPGDFVASKGEIEGGVGLAWLAGVNADHYEIYRQGQLWRFDGTDPPPPGFDPGFHPGTDHWELLGTTTELTYFDDTAPPGIVFMYKARSVNDAGASRFSNIDEGWAYDDWEPPFEGIHGYVWGEEWGFWDGDEPPPGMGFDPNFDPGFDPGECPGPCPGIFPLGGATLTMATVNDFDPYHEYSATSDDDGFYSFGADIEPGEYLLTCELAGWIFYDEFIVPVEEEVFPMQFDFFGVTEGTPPPGSGFEGVHGFVWGDNWIEGDPTFSPGDDGDPGLLPFFGPIEGALVRVIDPEDDVEIARAQTDADGFYQFLQLPAGYYEMTCEFEGWVFEPEFYHYDIPEGEMPSLTFDYFGWPEGTQPPPPPPLPAGLSGYVWDMERGFWDDGDPMGPVPLQGVDIEVYYMDADGLAYSAVTDADGFYHIPEIAAGDYFVRAFLEGYEFEPPEHPVHFSPDLEPWQVDFWGFPNGTNPPPPPPHPLPDGLSGYVWDMEGAFSDNGEPLPMAGVDINVTGMETEAILYHAVTDADGFFHIPEIEAGDYLASAAFEGYMFEPPVHPVHIAPDLDPWQIDFWGYTEVEPRPGPWPPIEAEGIYGMVMQIDNADEGGIVPIAGVLIEVINLETGDFAYELLTDDDGFFHVPLADIDYGTFSVTAIHDEFMFEPEEHRVELTEDNDSAHVEFLGFEIGGGVPPPPMR